MKFLDREKSVFRIEWAGLLAVVLVSVGVFVYLYEYVQQKFSASIHNEKVLSLSALYLKQMSQLIKDDVLWLQTPAIKMVSGEKIPIRLYQWNIVDLVDAAGLEKCQMLIKPIVSRVHDFTSDMHQVRIVGRLENSEGELLKEVTLEVNQSAFYAYKAPAHMSAAYYLNDSFNEEYVL